MQNEDKEAESGSQIISSKEINFATFYLLFVN